MRGCVPRFERSPALAVVLALVSGSACSSRVLRVVDPDSPTAALMVDLVGWWSFDEQAGSMIAHDLSGQANDGTLVDVDPTTAWVSGREGNSLELGGAGYALVPRTPSIDAIVAQVTVTAWIYFEGTVVDYSTAISREIGTTLGQHYHLSIDSQEGPSLFITTLDPTTLNTSTPRLTAIHLSAPDPVPRLAWTHLAGTYDGTTACLYVNGTMVDSHPIAGPFQSETDPLVLGGNGNGDAGITERFAGRIDEVMLYKRALNANEIGQLYDGALFPGTHDL
jgi:hypothetical protein